jgi:hypothetical protein
MSHEITVKLENGYSGTFALVDGPFNPLREDLHPHCMTRGWDRGGWTKWESVPKNFDWEDLFNLIPEEKFSPDNIQGTLDKLGPEDLPTAEKLERETVEWGCSMRDAVRDAIKETDYVEYSSFRSNGKGEEFLETLASLAGIPYLAAKHAGYCQGDYAQIFLAILPSWVSETGCPPEGFDSAMKEAARQFFAWCFGDVYYLQDLTRPDGTEVDTADLCFQADIYGDPEAEESGGMDILREAASADAADVAREKTEADAWACRDSLTVPG